MAKAFKVHKMYKKGKVKTAKTMADHKRLKKAGWDHKPNYSCQEERKIESMRLLKTTHGNLEDIIGYKKMVSYLT